MRVLMYHYVREFDPRRPRLRFLHIDHFRAQLDLFQSQYGFVSRAQWDAACRSGNSDELQGRVLLTFDDGLACSYQYVFPELVARGLWGMFFVPSGPYQTGSMLDVHKIHLLCASVPANELAKLSARLIQEEHVPFQKRDAFRKQTYTTQEEQAQILQFKRTLNYYVDEAHRTELIDQMAQAAGLAFPNDYYISTPKLQEMAKAGMLIGGHSVHHRVMSKLEASEQRSELSESRDFLETLGIEAPFGYCHPYGGFHTFDSHTLALLKELGYAFAFNVEPREIQASDWSELRYALPRFDCKDFPFGRAYTPDADKVA